MPRHARGAEGETVPGDVGERIMTAAANLFMTQGFAGTSVREIGLVARVGQSSLYHHIGSKDELLVDLHRAASGELLARLAQALQADPSPTAQIRGIVGAVVGFVSTRRAQATVLLRESYALPTPFKVEATVFRDAVHEIVDGVIRAGIEAGEFRTDLVVAAARTGVVSTCFWSYDWLGPSMPAQGYADALADVILGGFLRGRSDATTSGWEM